MKRILSVAAVLIAVAPAAGALADPIDRDMHQDRVDMNDTHRDIRQDTQDRNQDWRQGNVAGAIGEQQDINRDRGQLGAERQDMRQDRRIDNWEDSH